MKAIVRANCHGYGPVWCGVVWCGVVWCGVVWCGVAWCGVVASSENRNHSTRMLM
ncbi:TPA: hypothetical protein N0X43_002029 [Enterobacter hormaechei]|uniref:hypothetical protein n=1 Tax=Enterobacter cloacae complex sp. 2022EL-00787 TaxID=2998098 RepID=UPI00226E37EC|nr:hypothetical protein [Enterobacter cloacae complex sp. 2022EL-00787]MCY0770751.1 hypothetical protein [Enterobacter cloacae complex sp. 2022EL-00787]HCK7230762.1 hypothetical protein [Enterobacter hormaechei]HCK7293484.1 hypothetical protein [Enterobacter hormaechei]